MATPTNPLRAGVIGLGIGEQHIFGYQAHPDCEVVAISDIDEVKLREVSERHPGIRITTDPDEVLKDPSIDVVSIASYDDAHFDQVMKALQYGKHVFVEKPFVLHEDHARKIREALRASPGLRLSSNLILRQSPRFLGVKRRIENGVFGELYHLEGDYNYGRLEKVVNGWRGQLDYYSVVHGGGVHMVDLLLWLSGGDVVEVDAYGSSIASRGSSFKEHDMVVSILKFKNGMVAKMAANFGCVFPHFHGLNIYGTKATFLNGLDHGRLYTSRDPEASALLIDDPYPGVQKGALIPSFVDAILGQGEPLVTEEDVFRAMAVCFAIETSHREGGPVRVQEI